MRVNVVGNSNGVGLSRDLSLLAAALRACGCDVHVSVLNESAAKRRRSRITQWRALGRVMWHGLFGRNGQKEFDMNVMMEHVWPEELVRASLSVAIPNPEWFDRHDRRLLRHVDRVWAKTSNTHAIFSRLGKRCCLVGFDSEDRLDETVTRRREYFHLAGRSTMKGTERLLAVWRSHPEWPRLVVVQDVSASSAAPDSAANVEFFTGYLDDAELRYLQNSCQFHLCISETEGWGHYLVEAMSVGAVVLTVDAPPMNEFISPQCGLLLTAGKTRQQKLATCHLFDEEALVAAIEQTLTMTDAQVATVGSAARAWFANNKLGFNARIKEAIQE